jgi:hypothetical protein
VGDSCVEKSKYPQSNGFVLLLTFATRVAASTASLEVGWLKSEAWIHRDWNNVVNCGIGSN